MLAEQAAVALFATMALAAEQAAVALLATTAATLVVTEQLLATAAVRSTAAVAAVTTAATEQASAGLLFTADQGDADDREKQRDAAKNNTIHPKSSKKTYRYRKRKRLSQAVLRHRLRLRRWSAKERHVLPSKC